MKHFALVLYLVSEYRKPPESITKSEAGQHGTDPIHKATNSSTLDITQSIKWYTDPITLCFRFTASQGVYVRDHELLLMDEQLGMRVVTP